MRYLLEQGPTELFVLEACSKRGAALPEAIQNAPELLSGLKVYHEAFNSLDADRGATDRIPWTAMRRYADWLELTEDEFYRFVYLIREMDEERADFLKTKKSKQG